MFLEKLEKISAVDSKAFKPQPAESIAPSPRRSERHKPRKSRRALPKPKIGPEPKSVAATALPTGDSTVTNCPSYRNDASRYRSSANLMS